MEVENKPHTHTHTHTPQENMFTNTYALKRRIHTHCRFRAHALPKKNPDFKNVFYVLCLTYT